MTYHFLTYIIIKNTLIPIITSNYTNNQFKDLFELINDTLKCYFFRDNNFSLNICDNSCECKGESLHLIIYETETILKDVNQINLIKLKSDNYVDLRCTKQLLDIQIDGDLDLFNKFADESSFIYDVFTYKNRIDKKNHNQLNSYAIYCNFDFDPNYYFFTWFLRREVLKHERKKIVDKYKFKNNFIEDHNYVFDY
jgi:hypothetical protein